MTGSSGPSRWPSRDAVLHLAVPLIMRFEGFRGAPYLDAVGVPTIGYGTTRYMGGKEVTLHDPAISEAEARGYLEYDAGAKLDYIWRDSVLARVPTAHQVAAMLSLVYNIGLGAFVGSTLLKLFNTGDVTGAADQFPRWNKGHVDGRLAVLSGLTRRREAERTLFLTPDDPKETLT